MISFGGNGIYYVLAIALYVWLYSSRDNENKLVKIILQKTFIFWNAVGFMVYSKDNKGVGPKSNPDPDLIREIRTESKRIIFIRHGESDWNDVFKLVKFLSFSVLQDKLTYFIFYVTAKGLI